MNWMHKAGWRALMGVVGLVVATNASAQLLTVDQAVQIALENNLSVIGADAGVDDARGSQYAAMAGVLPSVFVSASRSGSWTDKSIGQQAFGTFQSSFEQDSRSYQTSPDVSATWSIFNLSNIYGVRSARTGLSGALDTRQATRNDVAFTTRQQFYEVVKAIKTAFVNSEAARLARDEERRVAALFEVGSVSKSDLLQAQVRTAQSQLDSLVSHNDIAIQRITLATQLGIAETELAEVDTSLGVQVEQFDESTIVREAAAARPDLVAAEKEVSAARASLSSANFGRLPYVTVSGGATYVPKSETRQLIAREGDGSGGIIVNDPPRDQNSKFESDVSYRAAVALNWNVFDGLATDSRIASSRARLLRAESGRDQLRNDLAGEVKQAILRYNEAVEGLAVAIRSFESAEESLKLIQQKYNVGSATILELINAQVSLQRAANTMVAARAQIKVAEAAIHRVRGKAE